MPISPSPLAAALRRALTRETDPLIANWFRALLEGGERAAGAPKPPAEPQKRRRPAQEKPPPA
jgi:hypothetical protein